VEATVGGEQPLQQRGSAAHHADHNGRRDDGLVEYLGIPPDPFLGAQSHAQAVHQTRP